MPNSNNMSNFPRNHNAIKTRFAIKFVEAMKRIRLSLNKGSRSSRSVLSMRDKYKRYRAVRAAAYASMASAVGPDRAWSRAVLRKIRLRRPSIHVIRKRRCRLFSRRTTTTTTNPRKNLGFGQEQEEGLRALVPGGGGMELCSLLTETAHYINCLQTQVQVMTDLLNRHSTT